DLRPRIGAHYEKELVRVAQLALKMLDRVHRITSIRSVKLESRNYQLRIGLRRQRQHRVTMYRLGYRTPNLVRRHLRWNKNYCLNLKSYRHHACNFEMAYMNRIERPAIQSYSLLCTHLLPSQFDRIRLVALRVQLLQLRRYCVNQLAHALAGRGRDRKKRFRVFECTLPE